MTDGARLVHTSSPSSPQAAVLVLHGGGSRGPGVPVSPWQSSVLRMVPIASRVARAGRGRLAVSRLLNTTRGWSTRPTPADDVAWALERLRERHGDVPVGLVGHSLGGRAALLNAGAPAVRSVVALAPWVQPADGAALDATGRQVLVMLAGDDRISDPDKALAVVRDLATTANVGVVRVAGASHSMLRHHGVFDRTAAQFLAATLLGDDAGGPAAQVLDGRDWVDA